MDHTQHSFFGDGKCLPHKDLGKSFQSATAVLISYIDTTAALAKLLELHEREAAGDETITMKEWNAAIAAGKKALEKITH